MTDFDLTRLAFKAAFGGAELTEDKDMMKHWSPLTDDGDALRLAVKLRMDLMLYSTTKGAFVRGQQYAELEDGDPYAATRRAIVRAAASIGESKCKE